MAEIYEIVNVIPLIKSVGVLFDARLPEASYLVKWTSFNVIVAKRTFVFTNTCNKVMTDNNLPLLILEVVNRMGIGTYPRVGLLLEWYSRFVIQEVSVIKSKQFLNTVHKYEIISVPC